MLSSYAAGLSYAGSVGSQADNILSGTARGNTTVVEAGQDDKPKPWWVYLLQCRDGSLYTGIAVDVDARLATHNAGNGARYTRSRLPVKLVYSEQAVDRSAALRREAAIKKLSAAEKRLLVG